MKITTQVQLSRYRKQTTDHLASPTLALGARVLAWSQGPTSRDSAQYGTPWRGSNEGYINLRIQGLENTNIIVLASY